MVTVSVFGFRIEESGLFPVLAIKLRVKVRGFGIFYYYLHLLHLFDTRKTLQ